MKAALLCTAAATLAVTCLAQPVAAERGVEGGPPPPPPPLAFNATLESNMVFRQAPAKNAVFGTLVRGQGTPEIIVTVEGAPGGTYNRTATVSGVNGTLWMAFVDPIPASANANLTVSARCPSGCNYTANSSAYTVTMSNVAVGFTIHVGGQSNAWLPLLHTFNRNNTVRAIQAGKYRNIRVKLQTQARYLKPSAPWTTAEQSLAGGNWSAGFPLFQFPALGWYFAQALTDAWEAAGLPILPIGMASTAIGGTKIESWMTNASLDKCQNLSRAASNQGLYDEYLVQYKAFSWSTIIWYQGENDMGGVKGNSAAGTGYSCAMPLLISDWRKTFSAEPGTTDPDVPFGVVTLAPSGGEGHPNMAAMRWAQTASYGSLPNPLMPRTFLAQTYDIGDPWANNPCWGWQCCWKNYNETTCAERTKNQPWVCDGYCNAQSNTSFFMGPIHPRDKKPVSERLAQGLMTVLYDGKAPITGPTISGCTLDRPGNKLTLNFNKTLLSGDSVIVQNYNRSVTNSMVRVLINASYFCVDYWQRCPLLPNGTRPDRCHRMEWYCPANEPNGEPVVLPMDNTEGFDSNQVWINLNITSASPTSVEVDLSGLNATDTVYGVRYAWNTDPTCCMLSVNATEVCPLATCPIMGSPSNNPANPWMARIENNKCKCIPPQVCDE